VADPAAVSAPDAPAPSLSDPAYRSSIVDLLGVLAYTELSAFHRLAADAALAPSLGDRAAISAMAVAEFRHFRALADRLVELGADEQEAMEPFVAPVDAFHESTAPADWLEGLMKAYVGDGVGADFYREVAAHLDPATARLVTDVVADTGQSGFVVATLRAAIAADPPVAGRLALWGRRLVGEMLAQAQIVVGEREGLSALVVGGLDGRLLPQLDLAETARMFHRLTEAHTARMQALGLSA